MENACVPAAVRTWIQGLSSKKTELGVNRHLARRVVSGSSRTLLAIALASDSHLLSHVFVRVLCAFRFLRWSFSVGPRATAVGQAGAAPSTRGTGGRFGLLLSPIQVADLVF